MFLIPLYIIPYLNPSIFLLLCHQSDPYFLVSSYSPTIILILGCSSHFLLISLFLLSCCFCTTSPLPVSPPTLVFLSVCFEKLLWIIDWKNEEISAMCLDWKLSHFLPSSACLPLFFFCHSLSVCLTVGFALCVPESPRFTAGLHVQFQLYKRGAAAFLKSPNC